MLPGGLRSLPASRKTAEKSSGHSRRKPSSEPVQQNEGDTLMLLMAMAGPETRLEYKVRQHCLIESSMSVLYRSGSCTPDKIMQDPNWRWRIGLKTVPPPVRNIVLGYIIIIMLRHTLFPAALLAAFVFFFLLLLLCWSQPPDVTNNRCIVVYF